MKVYVKQCCALFEIHILYSLNDQADSNAPAMKHWKKAYGLFTLYGTKIEGDTGNGTGTTGNNGSWFLYLSQTNVNISVSNIRNHLS